MSETLMIASAVSIDVDDIFEALEKSIPLARYLAGLTSTPWDDKAVDGLATIVGNPDLRAWFVQLLGSDEPPMRSSLAAGLDDEVLSAAAVDAGMPQEKFVEYIPMFLELAKVLLQLWKKRRGG